MLHAVCAILLNAFMAIALMGLSTFAAAATKEAANFDRSEAEQACKKGDMATCFKLADFLAKNGDSKHALDLFERVCNHQIEDACLKAGNYYDEKPGNEKLSVKWYRKACQIDGSSGLGCYEVARVARRFEANDNSAYWLNKACQKGFKQACGKP